MSKSNTLFSYFSKSPAPNKSININGNTGNVLSPKRSPNSSKKPLKNGTPSSAKDKTTDIQLGDVVWTRLEGYPWWPGMVCKNPTEEIYYKAGRAPLIHVQFFDEPISRGWVKERYVKPFLGADDPQVLKGGVYHSLSAKCRRGIVEADDAMKMTVDNRLKLVVDLQPSDESEEEEDNTMDFDPDIFDDEMSDEPDNSKENCEAEENGKKKTPKKTPSKSPKKNGRRSERKKPKRRRIMETAESGEESEDSFEPSSEDDSDGSLSSGLDEKNLSGPETESDDESPTKTSGKRKKPGGSVSSTPKLDRTQTTISSFSTPLAKPSSSGFTPVVSEKTKSKLASFSAPATPATGSTSDDGAAFAYLSYDFLQPAKIKDAKGNYRTDPDYDSRSIFIPDSFKKNQTPGMKQWWDIKAKHFDTILFFKMGKFYELFHMDAAIGVNELGLVYMRVRGRAGKSSRHNQKVRGPDENIRANLRQYDLEQFYMDAIIADASVHSLWRKQPLFDAIITDPPYGIREGAKKVGTQKEECVITDENYDDDNIPCHPILRLIANCEQPLSMRVARRLITMEKVIDLPETDYSAEATIKVDHHEAESFREKYFSSMGEHQRLKCPQREATKS